MASQSEFVVELIFKISQPNFTFKTFYMSYSLKKKVERDSEAMNPRWLSFIQSC
jgi:hypothetical protein